MMENYFSKYRLGILGQHSTIQTPIHDRIKLLYTDWTASGRMFGAIEARMQEYIFPFVANTHTDTNFTGSMMTYAYHHAKDIIKQHVNAAAEDVLVCCGSGMTGVVNKFQRILGLRIPEKFKNSIELKEEDRPIILITHMEHHSNQLSWLETIADVVVVEPDERGLVSLEKFSEVLARYGHRKTKIASVTACSNVTGIMTPYFDIAALMHQQGGLCFVDFACSAPYVTINMHLNDTTGEYLDAIFFSPHKFLGGPGSTGMLIFNKKLYANEIPDNPGGGTVDWTNPWGGHKYNDDIETREDGGTPAFLQTIKAAMCMQLKNEMGVHNIQKRELEMLEIIWKSLKEIPNIQVLAEQHQERLPIISFYIDGLHYNLAVKMLNDYFGIQTRGGCSCAGTYGHYLLSVSPEYSKEITDQISVGNCASKPGWVRLSLHPTHTNSELEFIMTALKALSENHKSWSKEYDLNHAMGKIKHKNNATSLALEEKVDSLFSEVFV